MSNSFSFLEIVKNIFLNERTNEQMAQSFVYFDPIVFIVSAEDKLSGAKMIFQIRFLIVTIPANNNGVVEVVLVGCWNKWEMVYRHLLMRTLIVFLFQVTTNHSNRVANSMDTVENNDLTRYEKLSTVVN